ncbi:MAG TPA: LysM peptidoglycan-binding domain-containing protein, partial [Anaerolineales bacterium]|nr:LysM peptidoglycan-binding domain-containing protein [Anaerolineales bacterium]
MQLVRQFGTAIILSVVSLGLVIGGLSLSIAESYSPPPLTPTQSQPTAPIFLTVTATAEVQITPSDTPQPAITNTAELPSSCTPPSGWIGVVVQPNDTLASVALRYQTTADQVAAANCLLTQSLIPGTILYVPPVPTNTLIPCGPPFGWIRYIVQPGDTLFHIAFNYGVSTYELQRANCLGYSTY